MNDSSFQEFYTKTPRPLMVGNLSEVSTPELGTWDDSSTPAKQRRMRPKLSRSETVSWSPDMFSPYQFHGGCCEALLKKVPTFSGRQRFFDAQTQEHLFHFTIFNACMKLALLDLLD